ncbi:hypothetical protein [Chitinimonas naiadis]
MSFVPDAYTPPAIARFKDFQLVVLAPQHADEDFRAVRASADDIRHVFGPENDWPDAQISYEENLADLARHEQEFHDRVAFAYALLDPTGSDYLGCVYLRRIKSRLAHDPRKQMFQAQAFFWLSSLHHTLLPTDVLTTLQDWLARDWPFHSVAFPGRVQSWAQWDAMAGEAGE